MPKIQRNTLERWPTVSNPDRICKINLNFWHVGFQWKQNINNFYFNLHFFWRYMYINPLFIDDASMWVGYLQSPILHYNYNAAYVEASIRIRVAPTFLFACWNLVGLFVERTNYLHVYYFLQMHCLYILYLPGLI